MPWQTLVLFLHGALTAWATPRAFQGLTKRGPLGTRLNDDQDTQRLFVVTRKADKIFASEQGKIKLA